MKQTPQSYSSFDVSNFIFQDDVTFTGSMSGNVYVWQHQQMIRLVQKAHNGPVFALFTTLTDGLIVSGAKEKG